MVLAPMASVTIGAIQSLISTWLSSRRAATVATALVRILCSLNARMRRQRTRKLTRHLLAEAGTSTVTSELLPAAFIWFPCKISFPELWVFCGLSGAYLRDKKSLYVNKEYFLPLYLHKGSF